MASTEKNWKKPDTAIAVAALMLSIASLFSGTIVSLYALNTANEANDFSQISSNAAQAANNLTSTALQISNFNTTIVPYIVEADVGRVNYRVKQY